MVVVSGTRRRVWTRNLRYGRPSSLWRWRSRWSLILTWATRGRSDPFGTYMEPTKTKNTLWGNREYHAFYERVRHFCHIVFLPSTYRTILGMLPYQWSWAFPATLWILRWFPFCGPWLWPQNCAPWLWPHNLWSMTLATQRTCNYG